MSEAVVAGLALVLLGGLFQGSFMLPSKWMAGWAWENYWLIFAVTAYSLCPWLFGLATVPHLGEVLAGVPASTLARTAGFGAAWGLGAVAFGLAIDELGMALGFAIVLGVAATTGTLIPLAVLHPPAFSALQAGLTGVAVAVMLGGVAVCSLAGRWKESADPGARPGRYRRGVLTAVASGLLSSCGNLGFAFGGEISRRAVALGAGEAFAPNAIWALLALPLFVVNGGYALTLLRRNGTMDRFRVAGSGRRFWLACSMGLMWMLGMALYGAGARSLGRLGPSFGWAILLCAMVLVSNALGLLTGEWASAPPAARRRLRSGIALLLAAICLLGYANHLGTSEFTSDAASIRAGDTRRLRW